MKTPTKLLLVYKYIHLNNRELARILYGEVTPKTLLRIRVLKHRAKKQSNTLRTKAYIPVTPSNFSHISFKDLKHYAVSSAFYHDSVNDLNLRYLADVSRFLGARTMNDPHFEVLIYQYLQHYINYFERNKKGNIKLYIDTKKNVIRGHHKNKALLYYIIMIIYCKHYRCPNKQNRDNIKDVIFDGNEDADDILNYYRSLATEILTKEVFL